jgi:hypothetical protein
MNEKILPFNEVGKRKVGEVSSMFSTRSSTAHITHAAHSTQHYDALREVRDVVVVRRARCRYYARSVMAHERRPETPERRRVFDHMRLCVCVCVCVCLYVC